MKTRTHGFVLFVALIAAGMSMASAQVAGDYRSHQTGNWGDATSWDTFDGSAWNPAGSPPAGTSGTITVQSPHIITVASGSPVTINGSAIVVDGYLKDVGIITLTTGTFTFNSGSTYELAHATASGQGIPTATWNTGSTCLLTGISGATTGVNAAQDFYNLTVNCPNWGGSLNLGWNTGTITIHGDVRVLNTGIGRWQWCAPAAGTITTHTVVNVNVLGNLIIDGSASNATNMVQVTSNGTSNNYGDITITISGNVVVTGNPTNNVWTNFNISRGSQGTTGTCTWNLLGDFTMSDATTQNSNVTGTNGKFTFSKNGPQTLTWTNINYAANLINMVVNTGSTLNLGTSVIAGNGAFIVNSGGGVGTAHVNGLNGNITTTGTKTFAADANVTFNGSSAQVTGSLLPATVNNLTINNAAGVSLGSSITVNGALAVNGGKLTLGTSNVVAASVTGGSTSNYIVTDNTGVLKINSVGASNITYPVGTATGYNPVTINNAGTADNFSVRVAPTFTNPPGSNQVVDREWTITEDGSGANATLSLQWNTADEDPAFVRTSPTFIGRFNGSQWVQTSAAYTDLGGGVYKVTAGGFTTFSPFGVANDGALPIQLASFTATQTTANTVRLDWVTLSEVQNYGFEVQKSSSRTGTFQSISGLIPGHGTTNQRHEYTFTENSAGTGTWFYRLKQIDNDGALYFTEPVQVNVLTDVIETAPKQFILRQNYPNPFNPTTNIKFAVEKTARTTLEVFNILGQKMLTLFDGAAEAGRYYTVQLQAKDLPSGLYFYTLTSGSRHDLKKLVLLK